MKNLNYKKISFLFFLLFFFSGKIIFAATLSIEANNTQVKVGDIVTATVYVNSEGEAINNIEGLISVPSDVLEIQSVSTPGSILNLWVEQPSYSRGVITFNGGVPNPGYTGIKGKVVTIFMKALRSGSASISFQSASVRANDGLGTDVLDSKYGTTVTVSSPVIITETAPTISLNTPSAPIVSSSLTPDSTKWYNTDRTTFSWNLPKDITGVRTLLGQYSDSEPSIHYEPAISKKTVENLGDGVWYFHVRYKNEAGWGKITHKKIQIDNSDPALADVTHKVTDGGLIEINLSGSDEISSVSKFVLSTEGKEKIEITDIDTDGNATYVFSSDYYGEKEIQVETFDQAGNSSQTFIVINFPFVQKIETQPDEKVEEQVNTDGYLIWGNKVLKILSVFVPILAIILVFLAFVYVTLKKYVFVSRTREARIEKIEKETMAMLDTLKENVREDIHLFKADKTINNIEEAERILLNNLLLDFKHIEKAINVRLKKNKTGKKEQEKEE
jgi:hypothetical protein